MWEVEFGGTEVVWGMGAEDRQGYMEALLKVFDI